MKDAARNSDAQTQLERLFYQKVGDLPSAVVTVEELKDLSGVSTQSIYQARHGQVGAAVALIALGKQDPEVAQAVAGMMDGIHQPISAEQGHGCIRELLAIILEAGTELARMLVDGIFCHRDEARWLNTVNRLITRLTLYRVARMKAVMSR